MAEQYGFSKLLNQYTDPENPGELFVFNTAFYCQPGKQSPTYATR